MFRSPLISFFPKLGVSDFFHKPTSPFVTV
jgi:hypothetical protein